MKKLVLAALAIGAMAACTKSNVQYEQSGEISFQPVTQKATKATSTGTEYPVTEQFNVWAWWGNPAAGTTDVSGFNTLYINQGTFQQKDGLSWGGVTPYYWPTTGSLFFAGYSPATIFADEVKPYNLQNQTLEIAGYKQSHERTDTKDLMWFDVTDKSFDQNGTDGKGVPVVFKHALSWMTFKFNLKDAQTPKNWNILKLTLTGIETKADFKAKKGEAVVWQNQVLPKEMTVFEGGHIVSFTTEGYPLEGTGTGSTNTGSVLVIPQSCAKGDAALVIDYKLKVPADNSWIDQQVTLPLSTKNVTSEGDLDPDDKWLQGKHYIYTIVFGGNEILIAPTVEDWKTVTETIPVE